MFQSRLPNKARYAVLIVVATISLIGGLSLQGLSLAAVYFAVLPVFACYALIVRPSLARRLRYYHVLYVLLLTAMVAGYLMILARVVPQLRVRWMEVPLAVWFLLTMHLVVWLMDRILDVALSAAFGLAGLGPTAASPRRLQIPKTAIRVLCLLAVAGPYILALFAVHWIKFTDNSDPMRQCAMAFEPARFQTADGVSLDGWFLPAATAPSDTTVIVVPGRGMPKGCSLNYAQMLCLARCNVLLFDLRGEGGSAGHSRSFGVREAQDVLGAVQYLEQTHAQASRHIYAFGISQGASAVIRAAAVDERVRAVVVDSTLTIAQDILPARVLLGLPLPLRTYLASMTRVFASAELGCNLFRQADLAAETSKLSPRPLLVIHGSEDPVADPGEATRLYEAAGQPKCLDMVPGAGHAQALLLEGSSYIIRILQLFALARNMDSAS
jgi:alpha-beta hydrolase superfamily lysophospholipase